MDLWIRTQNKENILKASDIYIQYIDLSERKYDDAVKENGEYFIYCNGEAIGQYKTKKRALEILDEIEKLIINIFEVHNINYSEADLILKSKILENMVKVYKMPKE